MICLVIEGHLITSEHTAYKFRYCLSCLQIEAIVSTLASVQTFLVFREDNAKGFRFSGKACLRRNLFFQTIIVGSRESASCVSGKITFQVFWESVFIDVFSRRAWVAIMSRPSCLSGKIECSVDLTVECTGYLKQSAIFSLKCCFFTQGNRNKRKKKQKEKNNDSNIGELFMS